MKINFLNHETNTNICLESDKSLIAVYGKNGVGKTTFSRSNDLDPKYVFNEDFIYSNVYTISESGASQTVKTKENFSGLWLGRDLVSERKALVNVIEIIKKLTAEKDEKIKKISDYFNKLGIPFDDKKINFLVEKDFFLDLDKIEESKTAYTSKYSYETNLVSTDDFKMKVSQLKENSLYNMLIEKISFSQILSEIILKKENNFLNYINGQIQKLIENKKVIEEVEKIVSASNFTSSIKAKVEEWYRIHIERDSCLFCGNKDINDALEKWKKLFDDKNIKEKQSLINVLKDETFACEVILKEQKLLDIDKEIADCVKKIKEYLESKIEEIEKNNFLLIDIDIKIDKKELIEASALVDNLVNFSLEQNKNTLGFYLNSLIFLDKEKNNRIKLIDKIMDDTGDTIAQTINEKFIDFGLNKSISIKIDKRSTPHKFTYDINGHNDISELSDGQKHKLALAIFVNYLEKVDLSGKIIVIDDPVVSLDVSGYIMFKQYLVNKLIRNHFAEDTTLVILTHDISYLYIQLSSIFNNEHMKSITDIFKLTSNSIDRIPIDFIKTDDITLFRNALDNLTNLMELRVLNRIFIKTFRILVDLKLRFLGKSLTDGIGIEFLNFSDTIKENLKSISKYIIKIGRQDNPSDEDIFLAFVKLREAADILGFDDFILESDVSNVENIVKNKITGNLDYELFEVINKVAIFLKSNSSEEMKNYVNHTRNSYSQNLIALGLDEYFD